MTLAGGLVDRRVRALFQLGENMEFEDWWTQYLADGGVKHFNLMANEESSREAWNAAIEHAAILVGKRGAEPGEMQPESVAREIRMLRSNA